MENDMMKQFQAQQDQRQQEIYAMKAEVEAKRDEIFQRLKAEEESRRAEQEYIETLRMELSYQEHEELALQKQREEADKKERVKQELLAA